MVINSGILIVVTVSIEKKSTHLLIEACKETIDNKTVPIRKYNKTVSVKSCNSFDPCKPYIASSIALLLVSVIITSAFFIFIFIHSQKENYKISITKRN